MRVSHLFVLISNQNFGIHLKNGHSDVASAKTICVVGQDWQWPSGYTSGICWITKDRNVIFMGLREHFWKTHKPFNLSSKIRKSHRRTDF